MEDKRLVVTFDNNAEPQFEFNGAWNIRDLGHVRAKLFRAYKHYMKGVRNERAVEGSQREGNTK